MNEKQITKIYITSSKNLTEKDIYYLVMSNKGYPVSEIKITPWNWLVEIEYTNNEDLVSILNTNEVRSKKIIVKRVFKSAKLRGAFKEKPSDSFMLQLIMGISGLIKKPINIRITNNRADDWQKAITRKWQEELENPNMFKKAGIKPVIDIAPDGELEFCVVRSGDYVITYFNRLIDEYT